MISKYAMIISSSINGGAQVLLANLAEKLKDRVDLIIICPKGPLSKKIHEIGVDMIETDVNFLTIGFIKNRIVKWSNGYECVVNPFLFGTSFLCAWEFRNYKKIHVFSWLLNPIIREDLSKIKQKVYILIAKIIGRYSDVIGVGSPELKKDVQLLTKKDPVYLENRVPNRFPPKKSFYDGKKPLKVCAIGRMVEGKRPDLFVRAARIVHESGAPVNFFMTGDGPLKDSITQYIDANNLSEAIKLVGYVKDIYAFLAEMDVLLITSEYENSPLSVLEAMNASLVVVAGDVVGIPHLIQNGYDGIVAKDYSESGFAEEIISLCYNPQLVEKMGRNSYKKSINEFSFDKFVNDYLNVVQESQK